jgi:hypothetical protein
MPVVGYDVHITRTADWTLSEEIPISLDEWRAYLEQDPEMRLAGYAEAQVGDGVLRVESEGLSVWTAYSRDGVGGNMAWFDYRSGEVVVKNPDDEILSKMRQIAERLGAHVIGDDGESYGRPANSALQRTRPAAALLGIIKRFLGGPGR